MLQQGIQLLQRFAQDDRIRVRQPRKNLQIKFTQSLPTGNDFIAYVDAIGHLDGTRCLIEWKTTSSLYPEEPQGLLMLDPQLVCYGWITGISDVTQVVFVRKRLVEIQYFHTTITEEQREEFGRLIDDTIRRIERLSSYRTAASVSLRIHVPVAPTSASAWDNRKWSMPLWYAVRETTLVCLTSLRTSNPLMLPKLNKKRALFVLTKIHEILAWEQPREMERDTRLWS